MRFNINKPERCSTKPFCEHLEKIKGTYHCTLTNEEVDNGDEEDGSDYIFLRTKTCLEGKMNNDTNEANWREEFEKEYDEMYAEYLHPDDSYFMVHNDYGYYLNEQVRNDYGFYLQASMKRTEEQRLKNEKALEALKELQRNSSDEYVKEFEAIKAALE